jgi:nucleotide-binding universal stress UspA family protein
MASMRDLVVHINDEAVSAHALELAALLAAEWDAKLTALVTATVAHAGAGLNADAAALSLELARAQREALQAIGARLVDAARQRHGIDIDLQLGEGDPTDDLLARSRTADLLITAQRSPDAAGGLSAGQAARVLVSAACPVLKVPYIGWRPDGTELTADRLLRRVLVSWADTRESARALRDALPLLERASHVELVSFADAGQDEATQASLQRVAEHLARHGISATTTVLSQGEPSLGERMRRGWMPDVAVGEAVQSHAADIDADLIVMGAYGHSRLWELVLGGVTRSMLESMTVPVLMSH